MIERTCRRCGGIFIGGPRAWYCPACREIKKKEYKTRSLARQKMGIAVKIGISRRKCEVCGAEYIVQSPNQKYCKRCAPEAYKAVDAAQSRQYCRENRPKINDRKRKNYKRKDRHCIICGAPIYNDNKKLCSDECRKKMEAIYYQRVNYKRGKRKRPPEEAPFEK